MASLLALGLLLALAVGSKAQKEGSTEHPFTMFVQTATGLLITDTNMTLYGVSPTTIWFEDRPSRGAGATSTADFLRDFPLSPNNPANAAIVISTSQNRTDDVVIIVEISSPVYDPETATVSYRSAPLGLDFVQFKGLHNYIGHAQRVELDYEVPPGSLSVALMIDDCPDYKFKCSVCCITSSGSCGLANYEYCDDAQDWPMCWSWSCAYCNRCNETDWDHCKYSWGVNDLAGTFCSNNGQTICATQIAANCQPPNTVEIIDYRPWYSE